MDIILRLCLVLGFTLHVVLASGYEFDPDYLIPPKCKPCNAKSCPRLVYCAGNVVKDNCGCCPRCSSELFQPHVKGPNSDSGNGANATKTQQKGRQVDACQQRQCPKFKVCMLNVQGLPICTCPSLHVCNKRRGKRANQLVEVEICGSDGNTYPSKCHLRLANCKSLKRIKRLHMGACMKTDKQFDAVDKISLGGDMDSRNIADTGMTKKEERMRLKALKRERRKKMKKRKRKNRRLRKKEKKERKDREKLRRRSKRRNNGFIPYSSHYDFLLRKHTNWSHNQVRKSRI